MEYMKEREKDSEWRWEGGGNAGGGVTAGGVNLIGYRRRGIGSY